MDSIRVPNPRTNDKTFLQFKSLNLIGFDCKNSRFLLNGVLAITFCNPRKLAQRHAPLRGARLHLHRTSPRVPTKTWSNRFKNGMPCEITGFCQGAQLSLFWWPGSHAVWRLLHLLVIVFGCGDLNEYMWMFVNCCITYVRINRQINKCIYIYMCVFW